MSEQISMQKLAEHLGVSKMTISLYMRDPSTKRISDKLKKRIQGAMKELNYTPPLKTQFNEEGKTKIIAILMPFNLPIFKYEQVNEILSGIQEELFKHGYSMIFMQVKVLNGEPIIDEDCILKCRSFDGVILFGTRFSRLDRLHSNIITLKNNDIPFVTVNMPEIKEDVNQIICTNSNDCSPISYLASLNHKRIALLGGNPNAPETQRAIEEYKASYENAGLVFDEELIIDGGYEMLSAYHALAQLLDKREDITAVYSLSMLMTAGVYKLLKERGLGIPDDISIIGQGDYYYSDIIEPSVTAVHLPLEHSGKRSVQLLLDLIHNKIDQSRKIYLQNNLVLRQSAARRSSN